MEKGSRGSGNLGVWAGRSNTQNFGTFLQEKELSYPTQREVSQNGAFRGLQKEALEHFRKRGQGAQEAWESGPDNQKVKNRGMGYWQILLFAITGRRNSVTGLLTSHSEEGTGSDLKDFNELGGWGNWVGDDKPPNFGIFYWKIKLPITTQQRAGQSGGLGATLKEGLNHFPRRGKWPPKPKGQM